MARAAARPSTDTKSTQSANFLTMCPGIFASCFSAVLDSRCAHTGVYPHQGNSQAPPPEPDVVWPTPCRSAVSPPPSRRLDSTPMPQRRDCLLQRHVRQQTTSHRWQVIDLADPNMPAQRSPRGAGARPRFPDIKSGSSARLRIRSGRVASGPGRRRFARPGRSRAPSSSALG